MLRIIHYIKVDRRRYVSTPLVSHLIHFVSFLSGLDLFMKQMEVSQVIGSNFLDSDNNLCTLEDIHTPKYWLLFFGAHNSAACIKIAPQLVELYDQPGNAYPAFEVLFVSLDKTKSAFDDFSKGMKWLRVPFEDRKRITDLRLAYHVSEIPEIVVLNSQGDVVHISAVSQLYLHPLRFPWIKSQSKK